MNYLKAIYCRFAGHDFRKAKKGEDASARHCRRCGATKPVRARAAIAKTNA